MKPSRRGGFFVAIVYLKDNDFQPLGKVEPKFFLYFFLIKSMQLAKRSHEHRLKQAKCE